MGLFSGKDITTVATSVYRVIDDKHLPNSIATGTAKNIFNNDTQNVEYVMDELVSSLAIRANQYYNYGRDHYQFGLPMSTLKTSAAGKEATLAAIQASETSPITLDYYHFGPFNDLHFGWKTLVENYGYDSSTNELVSLSTLKGAQVYLKDMQVMLSTATTNQLANNAMPIWGTPANSGYLPNRPSLLLSKATDFGTDASATSDYILVTYYWETKEDALVENIIIKKRVQHEETLRFNVPSYNMDTDYHQTRYLVNGKAKYWTYLHGSSSQPSIDAVFDTTYTQGGTFFPITYLHHDMVSVLSQPTSVWYAQTKKMCSLLGLEFNSITKAIDDNPDSDKIRQAMVMMVVPADTTNELEQRYLFDFFKDIYDEMKTQTVPVETTASDYRINSILSGLKQPTQATSVIIQDSVYKMTLSYDTIAYKRLAGTVTKKGSYTSEIVGNVHYYRHQVSETMYEEVQVLGMRMTYWIFNNYTTIGDENNKDLLIVPLNQNITKDYTLADRETLYARSLHYVINSSQVSHLKWYQTGIFQVLITIAAIVITVMTGQVEIYALAANIAIAYGVAGVVALFIAASIYALDAFLAQKATAFFVRHVNSKIAIITAIVVAAAGMYQYSTKNAATWLPSAKELVSVTTNLVNVAEGAYFREQYQSLEGEYRSFQEYVKEKEDELTKAEKLLDTNLNLSPMVIFGESPNDFYQRTVHSGNIAILGVDMVSSYVDIALTLPKLSQTVGDINYGLV